MFAVFRAETQTASKLAGYTKIVEPLKEFEMKWFVYLLAVALFVLHQDVWNFATPEPLLWHCIPVSAWYHAAYSIACAILMWLLVKFAWPKHLEKYEQLPPRPGSQGGH